MKKFGLFLIILALAGCTGTKTNVSYSSLLQEKFPAKTENSEITLTMDEMLQRPYREIGIIFALAKKENVTYNQLNELIRQKAREVGADAVIGMKYTLDRSMVLVGAEGVSRQPADYPSAQGIAVVFID